MRIAIGQISHETNTFCRGVTPTSEFQGSEWLHGDEMVAKHRGVRTYLGGMLAAAERLGIEVCPTFSASTQPSATIARDAYDTMLNELLTGLQQAGAVDAICLALHGAGVAEGIDDIEGAILTAVRAQVGAAMPVIVTLDLHGNITQEMLDQATVLLGVHEYPHRDSYERGVEAVELAQRIVAGELAPTSHIAWAPALLPASTTDEGAAKAIQSLCYEWEARPGMIDCAFFHGFAYADIPNVGVAVVATSNGDPALAKQAAEAVMLSFWSNRQQCLHAFNPPDAAIAQALATEGRPVVMNEKSDNAGGGAPADGTHLLRALIDGNINDLVTFGYIYDPETAAQAHAAGCGATIDVRLGGKYDDLHGAPIEMPAYVKCLSDGQFIRQSPMGRGARVNLGLMARLVIGNVDVIVGSVRTQTLDAELFLLHGIDVMRYKIVALKSSQHFRAAFAQIAANIIRADTPGLTSTDYATFPYQRIARPIWPLDPNAELAMWSRA